MISFRHATRIALINGSRVVIDPAKPNQLNIFTPVTTLHERYSSQNDQ